MKYNLYYLLRRKFSIMYIIQFELNSYLQYEETFFKYNFEIKFLLIYVIILD